MLRVKYKKINPPTQTQPTPLTHLDPGGLLNLAHIHRQGATLSFCQLGLNCFVIWMICNLLLESPKVLVVDLIDCQKQTDLHLS